MRIVCCLGVGVVCEEEVRRWWARMQSICRRGSSTSTSSTELAWVGVPYLFSSIGLIQVFTNRKDPGNDRFGKDYLLLPRAKMPPSSLHYCWLFDATYE